MSKNFSSNEDRIIASLDGVPYGQTGDFRNKRKTVQDALRRNEVQGYKDLENLGEAEVEQIRSEIGFFEQYPNISDREIVKYFKNKAESRFTIADAVNKNGRDAFKEILASLRKQTIH